MDPEALLADLDDAQRTAVTSPATPLAILAPAGSGKTRVLTRRIAWRVATGEADPRHVLALTFTRKAAAELVDRLRRLGLRDDVAASTFHAAAYAQLRARWHDLGWSPPTLLTSKARMLAALPGLRRASLSAGELATEIEWAKARLVTADRYATETATAGRRTPANADVVAELYAAYEERKRSARAVDFDDLLRLCIEALDTDQTFANAQRWRFRHLFVDEFQDVNPLQFRLLEAWRGDHYDLCVVGDPQQAIYGWNGADARYLVDFRRYYAPAEVVALDRNYRSTPQILAAATGVLRAARLDVGSIGATLGDGRLPTVERHQTDRDEASAIARAVRDSRRPGAPWSSQAVLVRTHAQTALIAEALRTAGIPARIRGATAFLERPAVRDALRALRALPPATPLTAALHDIGELGLSENDVAAAEAGDGAAGDVAVLEQLAHEQLRLDERATVSEFTAWVTATVQRETPDSAGDAVDVATFHAAKGLEWSIVHLAGLEDGFVPISHARSTAARAEEARLLHVAMTRARDVLRCTWAAERWFGSKLVERRPSPWLRDLVDRETDEHRAEPAPAAEWREHLSQQRELLAVGRGPRSPVLDALHQWRARTAHAARIEPDAVLTDRVLDAIAAAAPRDVHSLAAVPGVGPRFAEQFGTAVVEAVTTAVATPQAG